jgi:transposase
VAAGERQDRAEELARLRRELERLEQLESERNRLQKKVDDQAAEIDDLTAENEKLRKEIAELQRAAKRQATPFARRRRVKVRRKPGRPAGHPPASQAVPKQVDAEAEVLLDGCPCCGGAVSDVEDHEQFVVDIPPVKPHVTRVVTQSAWCGRCRQRVRTTHPSQVSRAGGAARVATGPRALGLAAEMKHRLGVPYRKIANLFASYFGLCLTHGAFVHADVRLARRGRPTYDALVRVLKVSPVVHSDETGWKIDGRGAWLWVFATPLVTVFAIRFSRGSDVVLEHLGADFEGTLVSDGLPALDTLKKFGFVRAQCLGHLLRRACGLIETNKAGAARLPHAIKRLLTDAIELSHRHDELAPSTMAEYARRIERRADALLTWRPTVVENRKLVTHMREHEDQLFLALRDPAIPATNNFAEQQIRGAVVLRKIGGCHRSQRHADAHAILASTAQTAHRHGLTLADAVGDWMKVEPITRGPPPFFPPAFVRLMYAAHGRQYSPPS